MENEEQQNNQQPNEQHVAPRSGVQPDGHQSDDSYPHVSTRSLIGSARDVADGASKTAMAAVLAGTIAVGANAVTPDDINLPEPVPIVQMIDQPVADVPDDVVDDDQDKQRSQAWKKALKFLLYALVAMLMVGGLAVAALQGCVSCAGPAAVPVTNSSSSSSSSSNSSSSSSV